MDKQNHTFKLSVTGIPELVLKKDTDVISVKSGEVIELPVRIQVDAYNIEDRSNEILFTLEATEMDDLSITEDARFLGPSFK